MSPPTQAAKPKFYEIPCTLPTTKAKFYRISHVFQPVTSHGFTCQHIRVLTIDRNDKHPTVQTKFFCKGPSDRKTITKTVKDLLAKCYFEKSLHCKLNFTQERGFVYVLALSIISHKDKPFPFDTDTQHKKLAICVMKVVGYLLKSLKLSDLALKKSCVNQSTPQ